MKLYTIASIATIIKLASASCGSAYYQCGGNGFKGENCCISGYTCKYINQYFSQCIPEASSNNASNASNTSIINETTATNTVSASTTPFPQAQKKVIFDEPFVIKSGETYDGLAIHGAWTSFGRGVTGQGDCKNIEGLTSDAVFVLETGATLKNVILGADSIEHVHCIGDECHVENVWWDDVCEDALSILGSDNPNAKFYLTGGGAREGSDKIVQHNSAGTVYIKDFIVRNSGKLYRSCGNCIQGYQGQRNVVVENVNASSVKVLVGINVNYGDSATLININTNGGKVCNTFIGNNDNSEPTKIGYQCNGETNCICK